MVQRIEHDVVFADAERKIIRSRVQEGIDTAIENGKRVSHIGL